MPPFTIFMFIFAGAILLYAIVLGVTKDIGMLPYRARASIRKKNRKKYLGELAKAVALAAIAPAVSGIVGIRSDFWGLISLVVMLVVTLWLGPKIMKDVNEKEDS